MNDRVSLRGRTTMPFGPRRQCDVCHLLEAEHPDVGGNDCYRRVVAARFPLSAVARQSFLTAVSAHRAAVQVIRNLRQIDGSFHPTDEDLGIG